ncbi:MAG: hypothetical protein HeimC3_31090 [Candidatus Heimdallarchaeota archaeon LC_3]|nr:MAG: hypothetical protein HeimC3_31090 [Candidatus Heimdallarchaeota archaeon LC_3]
MASYNLADKYKIQFAQFNEFSYYNLDISSDISSWIKNLEKKIHEPCRFGTLFVLYKNKEVSFSLLKKIISTTSGNLNRHLFVLRKEGLIDKQKRLLNSKFITWISITQKGKEDLEKYIKNFQSIFEEI